MTAARVLVNLPRARATVREGRVAQDLAFRSMDAREGRNYHGRHNTWVPAPADPALGPGPPGKEVMTE